jgi:hypothetical protein
MGLIRIDTAGYVENDGVWKQNPVDADRPLFGFLGKRGFGRSGSGGRAR